MKIKTNRLKSLIELVCKNSQDISKLNPTKNHSRHARLAQHSKAN